MSVTFILLLIKLYSTTYAECVKGCRKVVSILISYLLLSSGKVFGELHAAGMLCFIFSIGLTVYQKSQRDQAKAQVLTDESERKKRRLAKAKLSPPISEKNAQESDSGSAESNDTLTRHRHVTGKE